MKVIIAGSRHMTQDYTLIGAAVVSSGFEVSEVVCGLARGADTWGKEWAIIRSIPVKEFPADWDKFGKAAGSIRNGQMMEYADAAIVLIWDGSRGSQNMIDQMQKAKKPCFVVKNGILT